MTVTRPVHALFLIVVASACLKNPPALTPTNSIERRWDITLDAAFRAAGDGRYGDADRTIVEFQGANAASPVALEGLYWRALLQLHPSNKSGSAKQAIELLDAYLAAGEKTPHRREAELLRQLAATPREVAAAEPASAETERLKAELAKTQEELERIKRRLAQPRP